MNILTAKLDLNFEARSASTQEGVEGKMTIGERIALAFDLDIAYAFKVQAAAPSNVATLTQSTGVVAQTTGSPVITDGDGKDWQGITLPLGTSSLIQLVVVYAAPGNNGTVACAGLDPLESPTGTLRAGGVLLLSQPAAAAVGASSTLAFTFSAGSDSVKVWVFSKSV